MSKSHSKVIVKLHKQTKASIESHKQLPLPFHTSTIENQGSPILERDSGIPCGKDIDLMGQYHWPNSKSNGSLGDHLRERTVKEGRVESTSHRSDYDEECNIEDLSTTTKGKLNKLINEEDVLEQNGVIAQQYSNGNPNLSLQSYTIYNVEAALNRDRSCKNSAGEGAICAMVSINSVSLSKY
ncbi:hypothetical protein SLEP1_g29974 [Rubroshorea leprosula]|uniref:Uncharacterized protein n=1 Tax=Rubroshorea leprosula TaxID=152421 RepID=A0AAV5K884_9ROSI|nr:hypothetical protein SLEP1_g29974 [Rubroshorea leprosula]